MRILTGVKIQIYSQSLIWPSRVLVRFNYQLLRVIFMGIIFWAIAVFVLIAVLTWMLMHQLPGKSKVERVWPRFYAINVLSAVFLAGIYFISPQQAEVLYYKLAMTIFAACLALAFDHGVFPYARPDGYLKRFWQDGSPETEGKADYEVVEGYQLVFAVAQLRRVFLMGVFVFGVTLGL